MYKLEKVILPFFICISIYAQKKWNLDDCISFAMKNNLKLNDLTYKSDSNLERKKQAYRNFLPTINARVDYNIQYGRLVDPNNNQIVNTNFFSNNYSVGAEIDLFTGFQKWNIIAANNFLHKATQEDLLQEKFMLAFRVMSAFYDVQYFNELLNASKEQVSISKTNLTLVKKQVELGLKAGADLYQAEALLASDELAATQNFNKLQAVKLKLIQEMNLEKVSNITIDDFEEISTLKDSINSDISSIYKKALTFIPTIKSEEFKVKAAKKDIAISKGKLYPSLAFSASYNTAFLETNIDANGKIIPFNNQISNNASQFIGFTLQIPISNRWSKRSEIKLQKIALLQTENNLNIQKQDLLKAIQKLIQDLNATKIEYMQAKLNEKSQLTAFTIAQKKRDKGLISALELYQSKNLFSKARSKTIQSKLKTKVLHKTLDFYKGLPVFNINQLATN